MCSALVQTLPGGQGQSRGSPLVQTPPSGRGQSASAAAQQHAAAALQRGNIMHGPAVPSCSQSHSAGLQSSAAPAHTLAALLSGHSPLSALSSPLSALKSRCSDEDVHLVARERVHALVGQAGVAGHQGVLGADVQVVVQPPVDLPHLARRVPQALRRSSFTSTSAPRCVHRLQTRGALGGARPTASAVQDCKHTGSMLFPDCSPDCAGPPGSRQ